MASFVPHSHLTLLQLHSLGSPRYPECLDIRRTLQNRPSSVTKLGNGSSLSRSRGTVVVACASTSGVESSDSPKPTRRGRKKKEAPTEAPGTEPATRKTTRSRKSPKGSTPEEKPPTSGAKSKPDLVADESEQEEEDFDDGIDFPYEDPPLVCCFGAARREFVPTVRVSPRQMHPDKYSTWKALQWNPPEFVRAPGGAPSNVAIAHVRLGGRAAFMGKVGDDDYGKDVVLKLNQEKVQTRALRIQQQAMTAATRMKVHYDEGGRRMLAETTGPCAEDSLSKSELDLSVLKEARIFHFSSDSLLSASLQSALFRAIKLSKRYSGAIFFDPNLPLPLWESRQKTWELIEKAWKTSTLIEVSRQELEFLLDEDYYEAKRNYRPQYYSESYEQAKNRRDYYHYTREEILPLWHDDLKILFVTDGTHRIHYYTPELDGVVVGTEDVLITPFTCDRTGSGDAVVAGIMRKLTIHPDMCNDQDLLERHLRFAIAAGIISQWTIGAVRGFPTESATQNLKEQVYVPSMW